MLAGSYLANSDVGTRPSQRAEDGSAARGEASNHWGIQTMKTRVASPVDSHTIEAVKTYLARAFPHCRVEAFWTAEPIEYTFVAYDVRNRPVCSVILERELFDAHGPEAMPLALDDLGLADTLRHRPAPQVRVARDGHLSMLRAS
jgi:hypothetical protein